MRNSTNKNGYLALCYHYIRSKKSAEEFPRIRGHSEGEFRQHIRMLKNQYEIISLDDAYRFSYSDFSLKKEKYGMLLTFDDGLSDHYLAASILAEFGIKAVFFIPTCILKDRVPANPTIIHYSLAVYGLERFLNIYRKALKKYKLNDDRYNIRFREKESSYAETIANIKSIFKYELKRDITRNVLLHIYKNLFLKDYSNAMKIMHLTREQITEMLDMGHFLGVHTHSHISVATSDLTASDFEKEIIMPKKYIETIFNVPVHALSYPFGDKRDCLDASMLINRTREYSLAFTVENIVNTKCTSQFELGRYMPKSTDTAVRLKKILEKISRTKEASYANSNIHE